MESFRATEDAYITVEQQPGGFPTQELRPWEAAACDRACSMKNVAACTSFDCIGYRPAGSVRYVYACNSVVIDGVPDFTCSAAADLDGDGDPHLYVTSTSRLRVRHVERARLLDVRGGRRADP